MNDNSKHLITTKRLGLRDWQDKDIAAMAAISADPKVMQFFPSTQSEEHTKKFIERMQSQFAEKGYCYFAAELLATRKVIGFIGLSYQNYEASFTPCVDIGWRLSPEVWGQGLATEGARACLSYGHEKLGLDTIHAIATAHNIPSIKVMEKIGMQYALTFDHPLLEDYPDLHSCVLYSSNKSLNL